MHTTSFVEANEFRSHLGLIAKCAAFIEDQHWFIDDSCDVFSVGVFRPHINLETAQFASRSWGGHRDPQR
jgi:hypothetical protein